MHGWRWGCRAAVLDAFARLEKRHDRAEQHGDDPLAPGDPSAYWLEDPYEGDLDPYNDPFGDDYVNGPDDYFGDGE